MMRPTTTTIPVDPGFHVGRKLRGAQTHSLAKYSRKLHDNEENWTEGRSKFYYVDPSLDNENNNIQFIIAQA